MALTPTYQELEKRVEHLELKLRRASRTGPALNIPEALNASTKHWQTTFDAVTDSICLLDANWTIFQANQATCDIFRMPRDQIIGRKCFELVHGTSAPIELCPIRRVEKSRKREVEVVPVGDRWFEVSVDPIFDRSGELKWIVHIIRDISERKRSEEALIKSERTLRSIFKAAPTGIGMVCDRVIVQANDRLCEMTGYDRSFLLQQNARILYPTDEDYERVGREKYDQIARHGTGTVETRWKRKDGTILDILLSSTPVDSDDLSAGVTFTALDITERKSVERSLRTSHEMFLTVLDSIDATIYVADLETYEILFMNKHMRKHFGENLTGRLCWEVFRGSQGPCENCTNSRLLDKDGNPTGVQVWQSKNPVTNRWFINYDRAIKWVDGRLVRIQIATDITDLKRLESQLQQTHKIEAIGNLAGGIAHDFNNILSAVIGYTELSLTDVQPGTKLERYLQEVYRAAMRAKDLVRQILTFARKTDEDLKPVNAGKIASEVLKLLRSTLPTSIAIQAEIDTDYLVMADPTQLQQVFMNLCTNAAQAMDAEGGVLKIAFEEARPESPKVGSHLDLESGPCLKITIADSGHGIPEENLPLIFEPYFTTKPVGEGTGLGLAVVHGIVNRYGGMIDVVSEPDRGTVFSIYLPLIKAAQEKESFPISSGSRGSEHVLLIDDERAICQIGAAILRLHGYQVTAQTSSKNALELFRDSPGSFDIVVTDMTMPEMTGDRLASKLLEIRPDIPVILCTGYSRNMSEQKAAAAGIRALVMKPITKENLLQTVRDVLDRSGGDRKPANG